MRARASSLNNRDNPAMARRRHKSRHRGARQRRGFLEGEFAGHVPQHVRAQHCVFRQRPVEIGAEPVGQIVGLDRLLNQRGC